jgi:hypothetical protein
MSATFSIIVLTVSFILLILLRFPIAMVLTLSSLLTAFTLDLPLAVIGQRMVQGLNS